MPTPDGFMTAEEIAVELDMSVYRLTQIIKEVGVRQVIFPDDKRRRYSPEDVAKIRAHVQSNKR